MWPQLEQECGRLDSLIDEILNLARLEQERLEPEFFDFPALLQSVVEDNQRLYPDQQVVLDCPPALRLYSTPALLQRALDNLLRNALRFNATGQPVRLSVEQQSAVIRICVRDNGPGVDSQLLPHITRPFVRASGQPGNGHGLGLAIVQRCTEQLNGVLQLDNHPLGGFQACIQLPLNSQLEKQ